MKIGKQILIGIVAGVASSAVLAYFKSQGVSLGEVKKMQKEIM